MDTNEGSLKFQIQLDNSQLALDAAKSKATIKGIGDTAASEGNRMQSAFNSASSQMGGLAAMAGITSIGMLGKAILDTTAKFEKFGVVLRNTLGDAAGNDALSMIADFAATTPFQLDEVTGAFIKMANQGFVPTRQQMVLLGDVASSTGKSFDQLAEAILDAQTNQFERLKEFGIKASSEGDKVTFSFKEQKTTVENTAGAIQKYILSLGELKGVQGANALISQSLTGQMSNLQDKLAAMFNDIGTANKGLLYDVVGGASSLIDNYKAIGEGIAGLIAVYGVYKVAVMAVTFEQNLAAAANARVVESNGLLVASEARVIIMKERSLAAQEALNTSMLANPYVLAATAVAALGFAIYKVITYQTDLEKAIGKTQLQIENEKDKAALLFGELKNTAAQTDEWKKAKQAIIEQYGGYLTEQQKELDTTNGITEAYKAVNKGIEQNIALKTKQETIGSISQKYNPQITESQTDIFDALKKNASREQAVAAKLAIATFVEQYKAGLKTDADLIELRTQTMKMVGEVNDKGQGSSFKTAEVAGYFTELRAALVGLRSDTDAANEGFKIFDQAVAKAATPEKDPVKTTYALQIKALQDKKAILEKQLEDIKKTPDVDPMKKVIAKQGEIDAINKQLGIKDTKEKEDAYDTLTKAMEKAAKAEADAITKNNAKAKDAAREQIDSIGKKLAVLQKEKELQDQIVKIQQQIAKNEKMTGVTDQGAQLGDKTGLGTKSVLEEFVNSDGVTKAAKAQTERNQKEIDRAKENMQKQASAFATKQAHDDYQHEKSLDEQAKKTQETAGYFFDAADAADFLSRAVGDSNKELSGMLGAVANIAGQFGKVAEQGFEISKSQGISMAISGATQLVGLVVGQAAQNKKVMEEYYASVKKQQQDYNVLLNEQLLINNEIKGSVFIKDYEGKLNDSTKAYNDAQKNYQSQMKDFLSSEAITGKKSAVSGTNILSGIGAGAALGAGIGSVVPVIGTAIGAAVGALVGGLTGLFAKKKKDVVAPLLDTYPELISKTGEFNAALAKTLIANNQVTDATKATLENMIKWKEEADKATEQLKSVISDLTGGLGDDLRNALVSAFEDGTDAAKAFQGSVDKVLENIMSNMIFNAAFAGAFKQLEDAMAASYAVGGDQSWLDDFKAFYAESPDLIKKFNQGMADAKSSADAAGFDIFNPTAKTDTTATDRTATTKGITSMTQETANDLSGRFTAIQGHTFEIKEGVAILTANSSQILKFLAGIETNTGRLTAIEGDINAVKQGIDTINLKGIMIKV